MSTAKRHMDDASSKGLNHHAKYLRFWQKSNLHFTCMEEVRKYHSATTTIPLAAKFVCGIFEEYFIVHALAPTRSHII